MNRLRAFRQLSLGTLDQAIIRIASTRRRLIGLALLRIVIGFATILYCLADYDNRQFLWGPNSYNSIDTATKAMPSLGFSLFTISGSQAWFEILFHLTILTSAAFMILGGRPLTVVQAIMMWSLHLRNQDVLEGGDNLAQILIIFMIFTTTNAYFAPGARKRRLMLRERTEPTLRTAVHNLAAYLIVFQIAVLYLVAGYWKVTGKVWQDGVAMYYISRVNGFAMSGKYAHLMSNAFIGTMVCYVTAFVEISVPFAILSARAWIRKVQTVSLEGLHAGIMVFMGLVCFGLLMIGADCTLLRDEDYESLWHSKPVRALLRSAARSPLARAVPARAVPEGIPLRAAPVRVDGSA